MIKHAATLLFTLPALAAVAAVIPLPIGVKYPGSTPPAAGTEVVLNYQLTRYGDSAPQPAETCSFKANGNAQQIFVLKLDESQVEYAVSITCTLTCGETTLGPFTQKLCAVPFAVHARTVAKALNGFVMMANPRKTDLPTVTVENGTLAIEGNIGPRSSGSESSEDEGSQLEIQVGAIQNVGVLTTETLNSQEVTVSKEILAAKLDPNSFANDVFRTVENEQNPIGTVPPGTIIAWMHDTPPPGDWGLCDGTNGRPDLRGFFLRGSAGDQSKHVDNTLTLTADNLPPHKHALTFTVPYSYTWQNDQGADSSLSGKNSERTWSEGSYPPHIISTELTLSDEDVEAFGKTHGTSFEAGLPQRVAVDFYIKLDSQPTETL